MIFPVISVMVVFAASCCNGQEFFDPNILPMLPLPGRIVPIFVFPPVTLQAKLGGGFRASILDACGIEGFEFQSKRNKTEKWKGAKVKSKTEGNWLFNDPSMNLIPGEVLSYRCKIKQRGQYYTNPEAEWVVPGLAEEFDPLQPPLPPGLCPEDLTTPKPDPEDKEDKDDKEDKEETTDTPEDDEEATEDPEDDSTDKPMKDKKKPNKPKTDKPKTDKPKPDSPSNTECPAPGPQPGESREEALERKLWKVQCDMLQLAERSFQLNEALSHELTELKKLNYIVVSRIQRLESLLKLGPRTGSPPSFPSSFPSFGSSFPSYTLY